MSLRDAAVALEQFVQDGLDNIARPETPEGSSPSRAQAFRDVWDAMEPLRAELGKDEGVVVEVVPGRIGPAKDRAVIEGNGVGLIPLGTRLRIVEMRDE